MMPCDMRRPDLAVEMPLDPHAPRSARHCVAQVDHPSPDLRDAVDNAGRQTETALWLALSTRLQENHRRMSENGVVVDSNPPPAMIAALKDGASSAQRAWCTRSGPVCAPILDAFRAGKQ